MEKDHTTNPIAHYLTLGYVLITICAAVLILATPTRTSAIEVPPESLPDQNSTEQPEPDNKLTLNDTPQKFHTIPHWCGVNKGVKFNTGAVGTHTQGPIGIIISAGPPTAVTSVDTNSESVIPYKIVVNGGNADSASYVWPVTVKKMTAPAVNDEELPPSVSYVIVCYLEKRNTDNQNEPSDDSDTTNDDENQDRVLGASTQDPTDGDVLGEQTLANTGVPLVIAIATGSLVAMSAVQLFRSSSSTRCRA